MMRLSSLSASGQQRGLWKWMLECRIDDLHWQKAASIIVTIVVIGIAVYSLYGTTLPQQSVYQ